MGWRTIPVLFILMAAGCSPETHSNSVPGSPEPQLNRAADADPTGPPPAAGDVIMNDSEDPVSKSDGNGQGDADVEFVKAIQSAEGAWTFHVTVRHADAGWEDYADGWDVVTPDGVALKRSDGDPFTRVLLHPHETEQPFTRSQSGLRIPDGIDVVIVRAHDLVDGFGGREVRVNLRLASGEGFTVERG